MFTQRGSRLLHSSPRLGAAHLQLGTDGHAWFAVAAYKEGMALNPHCEEMILGSLFLTPQASLSNWQQLEVVENLRGGSGELLRWQVKDCFLI
jgi:hypothetical protein